MDRLGPSDLRGALDLIAEVGSSDSLTGFARALLTSLPELIPCDFLSYNEMNPRHIVVLSEPAQVLHVTPEDVVAQHIDEHPALRHYRETGSTTPVRLSDLWPRRRFHDSGLYQDVYRLVKGEYQLLNNLFASPTLVVGIGLFRSSRDFSDRDRSVFELLTPHLAMAYRNVEARTHLRAAAKGMVANREYLLMLDDAGRIRDAVDGNVHLLEEFYGPIGARGDPLPEELLSWVRGQCLHPEPAGVSDPLIVDGPHADLVVRFVRRAVPDGRDALILQRRPRGPGAEALMSLGLTPRESEVLAMATGGRTNADIAAHLFISPRTVKKHLESIYGKLGVSGRTEATAVAYRATSA